MSFNKYAAPLRLDLQPSRRLALLLGGTHLGALMLLPFLPLPVVLQLGIGAVIALSLRHALGRYAFLSASPAITGLLWDAKGVWVLETRGGSQLAAQLQTDSVVQPGLVILNFRLEERGRRSVVMLADSADPESLRRLRVRLRLEGCSSAA